MNRNVSRILAPVAVAAMIVAGLMFAGTAGGWLLPDVAAQSADATGAAQTQTIMVVGEGKVTLDPDIANVTIGVETVADNVLDSVAQNRTRIEAVLDALRAAGIADEDLQTSGFSVYAERYGPDGPLAESDVTYRVSNNVQVTIRNLENVGTILDVAIEAGANNIYGINFSLEDTDEAETEARRAAITDAQTKAEDLAELTGLEVVGVTSVSEIIGAGGGYFAGNFAEQARGFGGGAAPIAPGQLDLVMQLQVTFAAE